MKCGNRPCGNSRLENSFIVDSKLADEFVGLGSRGLNDKTVECFIRNLPK